MYCTSCGCSWHPACGHIWNDKHRSCKACTLHHFSWLAEFLNREAPKKLRARGPDGKRLDAPKGVPPFYDAAMKKDGDP